MRARGKLHKDLPAIRSAGYRQMWEYLDGDYSYDEMINRGIFASRQLAKRQLTWLRKWPAVHWLDSLAVDVEQQVAVEGRGDTQGVVIGGLQHR